MSSLASARLSRWLRLSLVLVIVGLMTLAIPAPASAHPLGNFTVNRYSRIELGAQQVRLLYIVDMAEIPTYQELATIDIDNDGKADVAERQTYLDRQLNAIRDRIVLTINGTRLAFEPQDPYVVFTEGAGGLQTLRLSSWFVADMPAGAITLDGTYKDNNYADRLGWFEVVVQSIDGVQLLDSTVPAQDVSNELRAYPQDLLQSPVTTDEAMFRFDLVAGAAQPSVNEAVSAPVAPSDPRTQDRLAALISTDELGPVALLVALAIAFGLGAGHALTPGHGKTIVAAYLVGSRGTTNHAIFLGLTTTITHTAGVFALGFVTLFVSQYILPEQLYPWLGVLSGLLVFGIGAGLAWSRFRSWRSSGATAHDHSHDHSHDHDHSHHTHDHDHSHEHAHHDHGHEHAHHDHGHSHDHSHDHDHSHHTHDHDHGHSHDHGLTHTHGGHTHSHAPPDKVTWRSLLMLGISGGLIPCPSALVVLLSAVALGRIGLGMLLIVSFSLGLAGVLTGLGILLVHAGRLFSKLPTSGHVLRVLPIFSAIVITIAGIGITVQALVQTGLLSF